MGTGAKDTNESESIQFRTPLKESPALFALVGGYWTSHMKRSFMSLDTLSNRSICNTDNILVAHNIKFMQLSDDM
jgi:hypothetical protein